MAKRSISLRDAAGGAGGRGKKGRPKPRRWKIPTDRAIHWVPVEQGSSAQGKPGQQLPEFFLQSAVLAGIDRHVRSADGEPRFGFLLGYLCRCPNTGIQYSMVDTALAAREVFEEQAPGDALVRAWAEAESDFAGHSGQLLGWYHSHHLLGLMSSEADEQVNGEFFRRPWQASVIVVPGKDTLLGGVFRHDPSSPIAERRRPTPFYELLETAGTAEQMDAASAMAWTNYRKAGAVSEKVARMEAHAAVPESPAVGPPVRSLAVDREVPLVIPGEGAGAGLFPAFRRRSLWPLGVFAMVMLFVALLTVARGLDRPAAVTTVPQLRAVYSLEERRFFDAVDGLSVAVERYSERAADFDAGRIGCDLLATGYVAGDATFVRIAARYAELGPNPKQEALDAFSRASAQIAVINAHFDGSGCPRP